MLLTILLPPGETGRTASSRIGIINTMERTSFARYRGVSKCLPVITAHKSIQDLKVDSFSSHRHILIPPLPPNINKPITRKQTKNVVAKRRVTKPDLKPESSMAAFLISIMGPKTRNPRTGPAVRLTAMLLATTASEEEQRDNTKASPIITGSAFHGAARSHCLWNHILE